MSALIGEMLALRRDARSGLLQVDTEGTPTRVYFVRGKMVFAEQGEVRSSFGPVLVGSGWLTEEQFERAMARMKDRPFRSEQWRFCEVVVELGLLTREQVGDALALHVQERILDCLLLEEPRWTFREEAEPVDRAARFSMNLEPLVLAAAMRMDADRLNRVVAPGGPHVLRLADAADAIAARFELSGKDQWTLERIDGKRTTAELLAFDPEAAPLLAALVLASCAQSTAAPPAARPAPARAGVTLATPLTPMTPFAPLTPMSPFAPMTPAGGGASDARATADKAFGIGKRRLLDGAALEALPHLRKAYGLFPDTLEYELCLQWAERIARTEDAAVFRGDAELWKLAVRAAKEQPHMAFAYYVLGHFAKDRRDRKRAGEMFRRAVELDANFIEAARQLRLLARTT